MLNLRHATVGDIPLLAQVEYEATLPPFNQCFWDELVEHTQTPTLKFIEAMLKADASLWGNVNDFWVLEENDVPVAAAAGYVPDLDDYRPLRLSKLDAIAQILGWSAQTTEMFRDRYFQFWSDHPKPPFLAPYAPWVIETVAVLPDKRGRGLGEALIERILEQGRAQGHSHAGIMVINGNERARHTYEAVGFQPYQAFYSQYFQQLFQLDFPGITKFCFAFN